MFPDLCLKAGEKIMNSMFNVFETTWTEKAISDKNSISEGE
jgi:hypothetical protein